MGAFPLTQGRSDLFLSKYRYLCVCVCGGGGVNFFWPKDIEIGEQILKSACNS